MSGREFPKYIIQKTVNWEFLRYIIRLSGRGFLKYTIRLSGRGFLKYTIRLSVGCS